LATRVSAQNPKQDTILTQSKQKDVYEKATHKIDSIHASFYQELDSLKSVYKTRLQKLDSVQAELKNKLNSIT